MLGWVLLWQYMMDWRRKWIKARINRRDEEEDGTKMIESLDEGGYYMAVETICR